MEETPKKCAVCEKPVSSSLMVEHDRGTEVFWHTDGSPDQPCWPKPKLYLEKKAREINYCFECSRVLQAEINPSLGDHYAQCIHYKEGKNSKDQRGWVKMSELKA